MFSFLQVTSIGLEGEMIASDSRRNPGKGVSPRRKKTPGYVEPILKVLPPAEFSKRGRTRLTVCCYDGHFSIALHCIL